MSKSANDMDNLFNNLLLIKNMANYCTAVHNFDTEGKKKDFKANCDLNIFYSFIYSSLEIH